MSSNARPSRQSGKVVQLRKAATLEMVRHTCPDSAQASLISESFGLPVIDSDGIRDLHHQMIIDTSDSLNEGLGNRAMQIHLQRIVGSYVGSAHGAGQFYSKAVTEARDATAKGANDTRERPRRSRRFRRRCSAQNASSPLDMGLQAHALRVWRRGRRGRL